MACARGIPMRIERRPVTEPFRQFLRQAKGVSGLWLKFVGGGRLMSTLLDGKALAARIRDALATRGQALSEKRVTPGLAVVLVGDDPPSQIYVRNKERAAAKVGVVTFDHKLPADTRIKVFLRQV